MHADAEKLLWDARLAADRVARFIAGKTFGDYLQDEMLRSAVERQLEIVGEALNQLNRVDAATAAGIEALPRVVAFRNIHDPWLRQRGQQAGLGRHRNPPGDFATSPRPVASATMSAPQPRATRPPR